MDPIIFIHKKREVPDNMKINRPENQQYIDRSGGTVSTPAILKKEK